MASTSTSRTGASGFGKWLTARLSETGLSEQELLGRAAEHLRAGSDPLDAAAIARYQTQTPRPPRDAMIALVRTLTTGDETAQMLRRLGLVIESEPPEPGGFATRGAWLRAARHFLGLSQAGLGAEIGHSQGKVADLERDAAKVPDEIIVALLERFPQLDTKLSAFSEPAIARPPVDPPRSPMRTFSPPQWRLPPRSSRRERGR